MEPKNRTWLNSTRKKKAADASAPSAHCITLVESQKLGSQGHSANRVRVSSMSRLDRTRVSVGSSGMRLRPEPGGQQRQQHRQRQQAPALERRAGPETAPDASATHAPATPGNTMNKAMDTAVIR